MVATSTGAPWLTRNEARARANLPAIDGADELVVPLNVLTGGMASPRDTAPPEQPAQLEAAAAGGVKVKARADQPHERQAWAVLARFFKRQGVTVKARLGGGLTLADAWEGSRWDRELGTDMLKLANLVTSDAGAKAVARLGFDPTTYDLDRTQPFLRALSARQAESINRTTYGQVAKATKDPEPATAVSRVFEVAATSRAAQAAITTVTALSGFATQEAGKQVGGASKTWLAGDNPRPEHAAMDGETVPLDDAFSNGLMWPGDASGDINDTAGCNCELVINIA